MSQEPEMTESVDHTLKVDDDDLFASAVQVRSSFMASTLIWFD